MAACAARRDWPEWHRYGLSRRVCRRRHQSNTPGATVTPQPNGTYKAEVQVFKRTSKQWKKKLNPSTFFPRHWSRARIEYEVIEAFKARKPVANAPDKWRGTSPSGLEIEGYLRADRTTFYPTGKGVVTE